MTQKVVHSDSLTWKWNTTCFLRKMVFTVHILTTSGSRSYNVLFSHSQVKSGQEGGGQCVAALIPHRSSNRAPWEVFSSKLGFRNHLFARRDCFIQSPIRKNNTSFLVSKNQATHLLRHFSLPRACRCRPGDSPTSGACGCAGACGSDTRRTRVTREQRGSKKSSGAFGDQR